MLCRILITSSQLLMVISSTRVQYLGLLRPGNVWCGWIRYVFILLKLVITNTCVIVVSMRLLRMKIRGFFASVLFVVIFWGLKLYHGGDQHGAWTSSWRDFLREKSRLQVQYWSPKSRFITYLNLIRGLPVCRLFSFNTPCNRSREIFSWGILFTCFA